MKTANLSVLPVVKTSAFWAIQSAYKPQDKAIKLATSKGNAFQKRLAKETAKASDMPKLMRRERVNKGKSSFCFAFLGDLPKNGKYPKKVVLTRSTHIVTEKDNKVGVKKDEKIVSIHANTRLSIGVKSGKLPTWYR